MCRVDNKKEVKLHPLLLMIFDYQGLECRHDKEIETTTFSIDEVGFISRILTVPSIEVLRPNGIQGEIRFMSNTILISIVYDTIHALNSNKRYGQLAVKLKKQRFSKKKNFKKINQQSNKAISNILEKI